MAPPSLDSSTPIGFRLHRCKGCIQKEERRQGASWRPAQQRRWGWHRQVWRVPERWLMMTFIIWFRQVWTVLTSSMIISPPTLESGERTASVQFIRQSIQRNKQNATVRYSDRSWMVKLRSYGRDWGAFFSFGWPAFARENLLHVEDVCVFKLIGGDDVVCRVYIFTNVGKDIR